MFTHEQARMDLAWLLAPFSPGLFAEAHWGKAPLRIERPASRDYFDAIFGERDLEAALAAASIMRGGAEVIPDGGQPRPCRSAAAGFQAFEQGHSLRINGVQRFSRRLQALSASVEQEISFPTNINLYLTPAGHRALKRHYDTHDVFVLQIMGKKQWRLFGPPAEHPLEYLPLLRGERMEEARRYRIANSQAGRDSVVLSEEFLLERGDTLFVPKGHWHEAAAVADSASCHLTLGVQAPSYAELLAAMIGAACASTPALRESLPLGYGTLRACTREISERALGAWHAALPKLSAVDGLQAAMGTFVRSRSQAGPDRQSRPATAPMDLLTPVQLRQHALIGTIETGAGVWLAAGSYSAILEDRFSDACRYFARARNFTPGDLPGLLSDAERIELAERLLECDAAIVNAAGAGTMPDGPYKASGVSKAQLEALPPPAGWLPIRVRFGAKPTLDWIDFSGLRASEPFFSQSVQAALRAGRRVRQTPVDHRWTAGLAGTPSGLIFHVSRCGSTLLANCLRSLRGTTVLSEPETFSAAIRVALNGPYGRGATEVARGLLPLLAGAHRRAANPDRLVVKLSSWNILALDMLGDVWPGIPCIVVIREPVEVMVSCIEQMPGWLHRTIAASDRDPSLPRADGAQAMEERCALGLKGFFEAAARHPTARILDYEQINEPTVLAVASHFGADIADLDRDGLSQSLRTYSKHALGSRPFVPDSQQKCSRASASTRQLAAEHLDPIYEVLKQRAVW